MKLTRRGFLRSVVAGIAGTTLTGIGGGLYVTQIEPAWLRVERIRIPIAHLPPAFEGYRLVQLSDLHIWNTTSHDTAAHAVRLALGLVPDLIVITGDFVSNYVDASLITSALHLLSAPDGVWAIMGNHDHWTNVSAVREVISTLKFTELRNESTVIERAGDQVWLAGVDDIWERQHDLDSALRNIPPNAPTILLAHEPDYADEVSPLDRVALQLSGHSHGGQVNIPGLGAPIVPYLGQKYVRGLYDLGSMWLYTNRGVGNVRPMRFNCRPEVTEITLVSA